MESLEIWILPATCHLKNYRKLQWGYARNHGKRSVTAFVGANLLFQLEVCFERWLWDFMNSVVVRGDASVPIRSTLGLCRCTFFLSAFGASFRSSLMINLNKKSRHQPLTTLILSRVWRASLHSTHGDYDIGTRCCGVLFYFLKNVTGVVVIPYKGFWWKRAGNYQNEALAVVL